MKKTHQYKLTATWMGNTGSGTRDYKSYKRDINIEVDSKVPIAASSDNSYNADKTKHNPEDLLLASLSTCHMLTYLYLCANAGVVVTEYTDYATGTLVENNSGGGHFSEVVLKPVIKVSDANMIEKAIALHHDASKKCYIANSVNFEVRHEVECAAEV